MKCNARRRIISKNDAALIKDLAKAGAVNQLEDAAKRAQYMWMAAMINAGLSPRTVERTRKQLPYVYQKYGQAVEDGIGDYALVSDLRRVGIDVELPEHEQ